MAGGPAGGRCPLSDMAGLPSLIKELTSDFELVVVDLPPASQSSAGLRLAGLLDGVLLVIEAERVRREDARRVSDLLVRAGAHPRGVVLNKWRQHVPDWLHRTS